MSMWESLEMIRKRGLGFTDGGIRGIRMKGTLRMICERGGGSLFGKTNLGILGIGKMEHNMERGECTIRMDQFRRGCLRMEYS